MSKPVFAQMSQGVIDESLAELKIEVPDTIKTIPAKVQLLSKYFKKQGAKLADCTVCGAASDENYRRCPFCGDAEVIDPGAGVSAAATAIIENSTPAPAAAKGKKPNLTVVKNDAPAQEETAVEVDSKYAIKDLDKAVRVAIKNKGNAAKAIWEFGNAVLEIYEKNLWRLRKKEDGSPAYTSFNKFCTDELDMSHTQAYRYMGITKLYTAETIEELGPKKLSLTVHQPEEERRALLEQIRGGASTREIEQQIRKGRANNAGTRTPPAVATDAQLDASKDVSIMVRAPKSIEIGMLGVNNKGKPAQTLADDPWCEEEHENGVISRYAVRADPDTGVISLVITRRRAPTK